MSRLPIHDAAVRCAGTTAGQVSQCGTETLREIARCVTSARHITEQSLWQFTDDTNCKFHEFSSTRQPPDVPYNI